MKGETCDTISHMICTQENWTENIFLQGEGSKSEFLIIYNCKWFSADQTCRSETRYSSCIQSFVVLPLLHKPLWLQTVSLIIKIYWVIIRFTFPSLSLSRSLKISLFQLISHVVWFCIIFLSYLNYHYCNIYTRILQQHLAVGWENIVLFFFALFFWGLFFCACSISVPQQSSICFAG